MNPHDIFNALRTRQFDPNYIKSRAERVAKRDKSNHITEEDGIENQEPTGEDVNKASFKIKKD